MNLPWHSTERVEKFFALLDERILILDGAMGTMIQHHKLSEEDFRGERLADHGKPLQGNNDILSLTRPELIESIHKDFLEAGCDLLETNTFNANNISQADYGTEGLTAEINRAGAEVARRAADAVEREQPDRACFVVGTLGPTNRTASLSPDVSNPGYRNIDFDTLVETYREAAAALLDGGVDLLMIETVFDTLNCKAAAFAIESVFADRGERWPVWISGTITDASGRTLSGQTPEAFYYSVNHIGPAVVGFNCALGADQLKAHIEALANVAECRVSAHPNAGLPNEFGEYEETPEDMSRMLKTYAEDGLVNIIGGCCGTTPEHLAAIGDAVADSKPRQLET